ncbi:hypothetical protein OOU_Y34scaffold00275g35 [Pyricularia oryzae Y34]|uniref:DNA (cytosine-5-)-methyltransferase n=2 Tax=Pyricularia oryzae TaxID=318829 RepID=A0AA97P3X9_PYRO3|nr:hypothetical protein OOU_Y34scaffold00275g35 [Pyricularia oryzae Y34]
MFLSLLCLFQVLFLSRLVQFFLTWKPNMTTVKPDTVNQAHPLLAHFACANHGIKKTNGSGGCPNEAKVACGGYGLVVVRFSNPVMEAEPTPCLCNGGCMKPPTLIYGANKYLWGTIPAIDVIKPQVNEGVDFQQDIDFLFAGPPCQKRSLISTFFHKKDIWPMLPDADPLASWPLSAVLDSHQSPAKEDAYRALCTRILDRAEEFHRQLAARKLSFELFCTDACLLGNFIDDRKFDRIEAMLLRDHHCSFVEMAMGRMLKRPTTNDKAVSLPLFPDAVPEVNKLMARDFGVNEANTLAQNVVACMNPLVKPDKERAQVCTERQADGAIFNKGPLGLKTWKIPPLPSQGEESSNPAPALKRFDRVAVTTRVGIKQTNTIVDKWPMRFYFDGVNARAKRDFARPISSRNSGVERYVEWKIMKKPVIEEPCEGISAI